MTKKALFVIASRGFQDYEYGEPRRILEESGVEIDVASDKKGVCIGSFGLEVESNFSIENVKGNDYDIVVMVGGPGAWELFHNNSEYLRIAREAKLLGAICIAPAIVSDSGLYNGVEVTGWDSAGEQKKYIEGNGGIFTGEDVQIDGNFITANGPHAATKFGEELLKLLNKNV